MQALLMGGQACILYGAAEFSRDVDFAVAVDPKNLDRLRDALRELRAEPVLFPPLSRETLLRGHACHFRCRAKGLRNVRIDVMGVMRGADPFAKLWTRRRRLTLPGAGSVDVVALPDLVAIKKTQQDKDWPIVRRLVEADIATTRPTPSRIEFWLRECRTPELLADMVRRYPATARRLASTRPLLRHSESGTARGLEMEERREREADRRYWAPLRAELERWRLHRPRG